MQKCGLGACPPKYSKQLIYDGFQKCDVQVAGLHKYAPSLQLVQVVRVAQISTIVQIAQCKFGYNKQKLTQLS